MTGLTADPGDPVANIIFCRFIIACFASVPVIGVHVHS